MKTKKILLVLAIIVFLVSPIEAARLNVAYNFMEKNDNDCEVIQVSFKGNFYSENNILNVSYKDSFFEHENKYTREGSFSLSNNFNEAFSGKLYLKNRSQSDICNLNVYNAGLGLGYSKECLNFDLGVSYKKRHLFINGLQYQGVIAKQDIRFDPDIAIPYVYGQQIIDFIFDYGDPLKIDKWIPGLEAYDRTYWVDLQANMNYKIIKLFGDFSFNIDDMDDYTYRWGGEIEIPLPHNFCFIPGFEMAYNDFAEREKTIYNKIGYTF